MKEFALVAYEDVNMSYTLAVKISEGTIDECRKAYKQRFPGFKIENSSIHAIVGNFDGDEISATYVQQIIPDINL